MLKLPTAKESYEAYRAHMQKLADVRYALAVLQWDQETYMPEKGQDARARQCATLSELAHELSTSPVLGRLLDELRDADPGETESRNVALTREDYEKQKKYPAAFVRRLSETISKSYNAWLTARRENRFSVFAPDLETLVALKREEAALLGHAGHPYDALVDEFEKGCTTVVLDELFDKLKPSLLGLLGRIGRAAPPEDKFIYRHYPRQAQWDFGMKIIADLGFDFTAGRQDISEHPFTTNFSSRDVRITTRINESDFNSMTWSCLHETGHALYEQGLPAESYGLPAGEYASLGIHESQSRLWENHVGRSLAFWKYQYPDLQRIFPDHLGGVTLDRFYRGINKVQPSLIRTEADELTYHFHVMIRYRIEKQLIEGSLEAREIPRVWNALYAEQLGLTPPDDKCGCLQDVHWSHGSFGYFPTYSLGSLYAAQFFEAATRQIPDLVPMIEAGNTAPLLAWLRQRIHRFGRQFGSADLCRKATGGPLDSRHFMDYLEKKYAEVYGL